MAVSTHETAIKIAGRDDRKWLIVRATADLYGSDADGKPTAETDAYYDRLFAITPPDGSITDEVRRFVWWLKTRPLRDFNGIGVAPTTAAKDDVAAATESTIESEVNGMYVDKAGPFRFKLMTVQEVLAEVNNDGTKKAEAETAQVMEAVGCRRIRGAPRVRDRSQTSSPAMVRSQIDVGAVREDVQHRACGSVSNRAA